MGAQQSSAGYESVPDSDLKKCYYELLGISTLASDEEIKVAYRKKALQLHPDRNLEDVENATRRFAEVQAAYEVLSDPQERAWYDSHRDAILRSDGADDAEVQPTELGSVKLTAAEDIVSLIHQLNSSVPFSDVSHGFYGILREKFDHLAAEEAAVSMSMRQGPVKYPPFGGSTDDYVSLVKPFYNVWSCFSTKKTFSWRDKFRLSDAPDRRSRRWMEKENKRLREESIREFNEAVRFLVHFAQKRDPRYTPDIQTDAERQKSLRHAAATQAAKSRAANLRRLAESASGSVSAVEPSTSQNRDPAEFEYPDNDEETARVEIECVICRKSFKSENQFDAHEKSKKHVKAVQMLRRRMREDDMELNLSASTVSFPKQAEEFVHETETAAVCDLPHSTPVSAQCGPLPEEPGPTDISTGASSNDEHTSHGTNYGINHKMAAPVIEGQDRDATVSEDVVSQVAELSRGEKSEVEKPKKSKTRRRKNAATISGGQHECQTCQQRFQSRTQLFQHIREFNHAKAIIAPG